MMPFIRVEDVSAILYAAFTFVVLIAIIGAVVAAAVDARVRGAAARPRSAWAASSLLAVAGAYTVGLSSLLDEGMTLASAFFPAIMIAAAAIAMVVRHDRTVLIALAGHAVAILTGLSLALQWNAADGATYLLLLAAIVAVSMLLARRSAKVAERHEEKTAVPSRSEGTG